MPKTVVGLMENACEARQVVEDLIATGIDRSRVGMMASGAKSGSSGEPAPDDSVVGEGVLKGAGTGAAFGGLTGLLAGLAGLAMPGVGPVIAAGPIATALVGSGIGAVAGGAIGALTDIGVPQEETQYYIDGLRRGGVLVAVYAEDADVAERSAEIMRRHYVGAVSERAEPGERSMPEPEREETGALVGFGAANETSFDPNENRGDGGIERNGRNGRLAEEQLAALDGQGGERQEDAVANANLVRERASRELADKPQAAQLPSSALSGDEVIGKSARPAPSARAPADNMQSRKPPKAQHAKANAVLAAALFTCSERRKDRGSRYTGLERRAYWLPLY